MKPNNNHAPTEPQNVSAQDPGAQTANRVYVHASCVSIDNRGLLITGASGSGKSSLVLQLLALGAQLVSDDQTGLEVQNGRLIGHVPPSIKNMIEARGLGILSVPSILFSPIVATLDLNQSETARLPLPRQTELLGVSLPCLHRVDTAAFPSALICYLKYGRKDEN